MAENTPPVRSRLYLEPEDVMYGRKQYRAPFKVHVVEWNPRCELLALASKKGDVMVKRPGWKKCWKINVASVVDPLIEKHDEVPRTVESMAWNPAGDMLAVAMSDGHYHLIDVSFGIIRWSKLIRDGSCPVTLTKIRWFKNRDEKEDYGHEHFDSHFSDLSGEEKALAKLSDKREEQHEENERMCEMMLLEAVYRDSLRGTLLFAMRDDLKISIIAAGVLPVAEIDINVACESLNLMAISVYDVMYSSDVGGVSILTTTHGPRPHCGGDGRFGVPVTPQSAPVTPHTHVVNIAFSLRESKRIWHLVESYVKMYNRYHQMSNTLRTMTKEWATQSQIFVNRLKPPKGLDVGETLYGGIINGGGGPLSEAWMERTLSQGITGMREFLDNTFAELISTIRGTFSSAVRCFSFNSQQFKDQIDEYSESHVDDVESLLFPKKNADVHVYPFDGRSSISARPNLSSDQLVRTRSVCDRIDSLSDRLLMKTQQAVVAAVANVRELHLLVRWMCLFPPLLRSNKKNIAFIHQSRYIEIHRLVEYVLNTFMREGEYRTYLERGCLHIDEVLKEMCDEEAEDGYNEEKYLKDVKLVENLVKKTLRPARSLDNEAEFQAKLERMEARSRRNNKQFGLGLRMTRVPNWPMATSSGDGSKDSETDPSGAGSEENGVQWNPKLDKIADFWSDKLSEASLRLLGDRQAGIFDSGSGEEGVVEWDNKENDADSFKSSTLKTLLDEARRVVDDAAEVIAHVGEASRVNWIYELASDEAHTGFSSASLARWNWSRKLTPDEQGLKILAGTKTRLADEFVAMHMDDMMNAVSMVACTSSRCVMHTILPRDSSGLFSGPQEQLTLELNSGVELILQSPARLFMDERMDEGSLAIVIPEDSTHIGVLQEICGANLQQDGYLYVLIKTRSEMTGDVRRVLKCHPLVDTWSIHVNTVRTELMESLHLCPSALRGCVVSDEATSVSLFTTTNPEEDDSQEQPVYELEEVDYRVVVEQRARGSRHAEPSYFHVYDGDVVMRVQADDDER